MVVLKNLAIAAAALVSSVLAAPTVKPRDTTLVEGGYIIKLKPGVSNVKSHMAWAESVHARSINKRDYTGIEREYGSDGFHGYSGHFDEATIAELEASEDVAYVEKDQVWTIMDVWNQDDAPEGLASISHRAPYSAGYAYDDRAGEGTYGYVVDSGIRYSHVEFEGRAEFGWTAYPGDDVDTSGHGTHCAGTIGGRTFGVSKRARLVSVKVFQGNEASMSIIMEGYEWAVNDIIAKGRQNNAAINLSLGGGFSQAFNDAVDAAAAMGVTTVVAAGNFAVDASSTSPASAPSAITVGAVNANWDIAIWPMNTGSNWGPALDLFAPGDMVLSAGIAADDATMYMSGTSMATPHVVGLALYAMSVNGIVGPQAVTDHLVSNAGKDVVGGDLRGSINRMANNGQPFQ